MNEKILRYGIIGTLILLPAYGLRFNIFGLPTTALEIYFLLFVAASLIWSRTTLFQGLRTAFQQTTVRQISFALFLILIAALISIFVAPNHLKALGIFKAYYLEPMIFWLMIVASYQKRSPLELCYALLIPATLISVFALIQRLGFWPIPAIWANEMRVTSLYSYPNAVGLFLAPIIAMVGVMLLQKTRTLDPDLRRGDNQLKVVIPAKAGIQSILILVFVLLISSLSIFFSKTEAAWLTLIVTAFIFGFTHEAWRRKTAATLVVFLFALALIQPLGGVVIEKLFLQDFSGAVRRTTWVETSHLLRNLWLTGAGLSGYQTMMAPYHLQKDIEIFMYPHNIFLNFWVELGLLGLIAFLWLVKQIYKISHSITNESKWLALAPLLVMLIHGPFDVPFFKNDLAMMTMLFLAIFTIFSQYETDAT